MDRLLDFFWNLSPAGAWFWCGVENVVLFGLSLTAGEVLVRAFRRSPVTDPPRPLEAREVALAALCVVCNTVVTVAGWWLWRRGVIVIRRETGWRGGFDGVVRLAAVDFPRYWVAPAAP